MDGEVDHDVDGRVAQQILDGGVGTAAMLLGERVRPGRIEIRGCHQVDLRMGEDVARVAAGDVAGAHDADAEWVHGRSLRDCRMVSVMRLDQIALQLYTVRALAAADLAGTLRAVAAAGYRSVELAGLPDTAPQRARPTPDRDGIATHRVARGHRATARGSDRGGRPS